MIAGFKAASAWDKVLAIVFALITISHVISLSGAALIWLCMTVCNLRVLDLEHKLRLLGVEP